MRFEVNQDDGDLLIAGAREELEQLAAFLLEAASGVEIQCGLITEDGVAQATIMLEDLTF